MKRGSATPVHYFDLSAGAVTLLVTAGVVKLAADPGSAWTPAMIASIITFAGALLTLILCRSRAYRQETPWLAAGFTAAAVFAVVSLFSALHVVWFAIALAGRRRRSGETWRTSSTSVSLCLGWVQIR